MVSPPTPTLSDSVGVTYPALLTVSVNGPAATPGMANVPLELVVATRPAPASTVAPSIARPVALSMTAPRTKNTAAGATWIDNLPVTPPNSAVMSTDPDV